MGLVGEIARPVASHQSSASAPALPPAPPPRHRILWLPRRANLVSWLAWLTDAGWCAPFIRSALRTWPRRGLVCTFAVLVGPGSIHTSPRLSAFAASTDMRGTHQPASSTDPGAPGPPGNARTKTDLMPHPRWTPPDVPFTTAMAGVSRRNLYASVRRGDTKLLQSGVFIANEAWPDDQRLQHLVMTLARQLRWPHLVGSHQSAALAHELPLLKSGAAAAGRPRYTRAPGPGVRSSSQPLVTVRELPQQSVTDLPAGTVRGLKVTTPARTALDLAYELPLPEALMLTDHVARQSLTAAVGEHGIRRLVRDATDLGTTDGSDLSLTQQQAALRPMELAIVSVVHRRPNVARVLSLTDPLRESPPESMSYGVFALAGLPIPKCQVRFWVSPTQEFRVDFYWPEFALVGECDGSIKYDGTFGPPEESLVDQNVREQALRDLGLHVVRWTAKEIFFMPHLVVGRVAHRLTGLGWAGPGSR